MIKFLCTAHENGAPKKTCAKYAGIDRKTLYNWLEKGEKAKSGKFRKFYLLWQKADAKFQIYHLDNINKQSKDDWRASRYLLEVNSPDDFVIEKRLQTKNKTEVKVEEVKSLTDREKENEDYFRKLEEDMAKTESTLQDNNN